MAKTMEQKILSKKRYIANLYLIADLYHIGYVKIDYLIECLDHIIERNERIQRKHFADIDYIRCIKLFIKNIRPNIDHLSNESFRMAKQYRLICKRLDKILKSSMMTMMANHSMMNVAAAAAAASADHHDDDDDNNNKNVDDQQSITNDQSPQPASQPHTFAMKISKIFDSINNNNNNNNNHNNIKNGHHHHHHRHQNIIERRHHSF
ncbi:hypothetical protein DERF_011826 [Dermatophagoides farinae]|uniref:Uncharacterized protein n=1 Tax=Dermatophagoides farinae TaxID=6954 RepID=A0A922L208_DERFA|nr:hypothetical protein DERF_011826 [Dermatophagoides farinae]